jgi:hypothetical protein
MSPLLYVVILPHKPQQAKLLLYRAALMRSPLYISLIPASTRWPSACHRELLLRILLKVCFNAARINDPLSYRENLLSTLQYVSLIISSLSRLEIHLLQIISTEITFTCLIPTCHIRTSSYQLESRPSATEIHY